MTKGILHGPYDQWTRKIGGKTVNLNRNRSQPWDAEVGKIIEIN
jgi:hypothetical protein